MRIELTDDNGAMNDGVPTLVVLVIDGKTRIPYEATKTIQQLYEDVGKMNPETKSDKVDRFIDLVMPDTSAELLSGKDNNICKEDIVKCIKVYPREEGSGCEMEVGNEYRVLSISKDRGKATAYEIIDDNTANSFRMKCMPDEVSFLRKRKVKTNPVKKDYVDKAWEEEVAKSNK